MSQDGLFFYGMLHHLVFDPMNRGQRQQILVHVPPGSSVLDIVVAPADWWC